MDGFAEGSDHEAARLSAVRRYDILDTPPDGIFDRITALAARRFSVPISIISIVDHDRIWFKSHHGLDVQQIGRGPGLCASAIMSPDPWVLTDARTDPRSLANPLVAGEFGLRFYAGIPLRSSDGFNLGTLCVIDREPRPICAEQIEDLKDLASLVIDQMELRLSAKRAVEHAEIMSREVDHRVMNSLQFVSSMLRMQSRTSVNSETAAHLQTAATRVMAVAKVHQHCHLDGPSELVACLPYLRRLCADLGSIVEGTITVEGMEALVAMRQIQPIGLIVNELVTNSAKHGGGIITVSLTVSEPGFFMLCVRDEGEGVASDFDPIATSSGLGMKLLTVLTQQLNGQISAGPNPLGRGAYFKVRFPAT